MSDDALRIDIQTIGGERAVKILTTLADKTQEVTDLLENTGWGNKEISALTREFNSLSGAISNYSKAVQDVNKANNAAAMGEQKLATEMNRTALQAAKLEMQHMRNAAAAQKMATAAEKAQAPYNQLKAELAAAELALKNLYTTGEKGTNLNAAISEYQRLSAAVQDVNNKMKMSASGSYSRMNEELQQYGNRLKEAIAAGNLNDVTLGRMGEKYKRLQGEVAAVDDKFKQLTGQMEDTGNESMALSSLFGNLAADGIQRVIASLGNMIGDMSKAGVAMDGIKNTMAAGARGLRQGADEMAFTADMAGRLGLNLQSTYEPYAKFMTSFTRSGGTIAQSRQIFEDLSTAMVSLHLSSAQMENVFVALEQMANKGTVQAEELKRQLGNALPGAFELAAQSMGITAGELMDLMKKGEVMSKDFLPNFAAMVKDSLGKQIGIAVDQYNAHLNRMQTQTFLLQANVGQAMNNAFVPFIKIWTNVLGLANRVTGGLGESAAAVTAMQAAMLTAATASVIFVTKFGVVNTALTAMKANAIAAGKALWALVANPVGATLLAVGAAALYCANSVSQANKSFEEAAVQQRDVTNNVTGLISEFTQLAEIQNRSSAQQEAYNRNLEMLRSQYPEVLQYIQEHGISIKNVTDEQAKNIAKMAIQSEMMKAQQLYVDELSNKWLIFGARCKQVGLGVVLVLQGVGAGIVHVVVAVGQAVTRLVSLATKAFAEVAEKGAWVASKIGAKEMAVALDNASKSMNGFADSAWNVGKATHNYINSGLSGMVDLIKQVDFDRQDKAMQRYKDTVAILGQEEAKLASQLMYTSSSVTGLHTGGDSKGKGKGKGKGKSSRTTKVDDAYEALQKSMKAHEEEIRLMALAGDTASDRYKQVSAAYIREKAQIEEVNRQVALLTQTEVTGWDLTKKKAEAATKTYQYRLANSTAYTAAEIENAKQTMKNLNTEIKYQEVLKKREDILQITNREASKLSDTLIDSLLDFDSNLSVWDRFKNAALSAIKSVATSWIKEIGNSVLAGWQAGWAKNGSGNRFVSALLGAGSGFAGTPLEGTKDNPTYTGTGALNGAFGGIQKAWANVKQKFGWGQSSGSLTGAAASITGDADTGSILSTLTGQATGLSDALLNATNPAISSTITGLGGMASSAIDAGIGVANVASPAVSAAGSIASMATAAPIAAAGLGAMAAVMTIASSAFTTAAPALTTMAGAMASLAASASTAATAMAALAVATAAESVAKIPFVGGFLAPLAATLTGAGIAAGTVMTGAGIAAGAAMAGGGQMIGGAMSGLGNKLSGVSSLSKSTNIVPHAKGGIVSSPTMFPMQGGNVGLAGEAGTEVIAPAKRMANGDVGIGAVAPQVTINNYTNAAVEVKRRPDNSTEIKIAELNSMLASSRSNKGMVAAQSRLQKQGRQIG